MCSRAVLGSRLQRLLVIGTAQAVLSVPLRGVNLAPLHPVLQPQPGLSAFLAAAPPPSGAQPLATRQPSGSLSVSNELSV